jgi:dihydrofolate reductase
VVSRQNLEFTWRNSERLKGDLAEAVAALKIELGGDIGMSGSISVVRELLAAGLLDELHLLVHPIVVGNGMRLFDEGESIPLKPVTTRQRHICRSEFAESTVIATISTRGFCVNNRTLDALKSARAPASRRP